MKTAFRCSGWVGVLGVIIIFAASAGALRADSLVRPNDAVAHRVWYPGGNAYWVDSESSGTLSIYRDTSGYYTSDRWWDIAVLEFPTSGLAAGPATLNFFVSQAGNGPIWVRYVGGDEDGVVNAADWLNIGSEIGQFDGAVTGWHSFDVTSQVADGLDHFYDWLVFTIGSADQWAGTTIYSNEADLNGPYLSIVPEPSGLAILAAGLFGIVAVNWRRLRR